jgi:hypothetical protein
LKDLVIVLSEIITDAASDSDMKSILRDRINWINEHLLSPNLGLPSEVLTELITNKEYDDFRKIKLPEKYDRTQFQQFARYCYGSLSRGLSEWWAPSKESQKEKDDAVECVYVTAKRYLLSHLTT